MLTVIDTFSKYAWAEASKYKNAVDVSNAFKKILVMGRVPKNLQTDDGNEFFNKEFTSLMQKYLMFREFKICNETKHRTIKMAPMDVNSKGADYLLKTVDNRIKMFNQHTFHESDYVRKSKYQHLFEKGYTPNFSTEIFRIKSIQISNPVTYILEDYQGNPIKGGLYEEEIPATKFTKWLGFSSQHSSWIKKN